MLFNGDPTSKRTLCTVTPEEVEVIEAVYPLSLRTAWMARVNRHIDRFTVEDSESIAHRFSISNNYLRRLMARLIESSVTDHEAPLYSPHIIEVEGQPTGPLRERRAMASEIMTYLLDYEQSTYKVNEPRQ